MSQLDPVQIAALKKRGQHGITKRGKQMDEFINLAVIHRGPECLIWPFHRDDQGRAKTQRRKNGKQIIISRLVCERAHGTPSSGMYALHSCGKSHQGCVSGSHLYWGTPKENTLDSVRHGTRIKGEKVIFSKLTEEQVRMIKYGNLTYSELKSFGVTLQNIDYILQGKTWKHVNS
jgi:hypothetical protein